jgi:hypothetical protein
VINSFTSSYEHNVEKTSACIISKLLDTCRNLIYMFYVISVANLILICMESVKRVIYEGCSESKLLYLGNKCRSGKSSRMRGSVTLIIVL